VTTDRKEKPVDLLYRYAHEEWTVYREQALREGVLGEVVALDG